MKSDNQLFFENDLLNHHLKITSVTPMSGTQKGEGFFDSAKKHYKLLTTAKNLGARRFIYSQTIFPKSINTTLSEKKMSHLLNPPSLRRVHFVVWPGLPKKPLTSSKLLKSLN